jgi:RHS repeat-associated protein
MRPHNFPLFMTSNTRVSRLLLPVLLIVALSDLRGQANDNPTGPSGSFNGNITTGCSYDAYTGNATRSVTDIVVAGAVGSYPLAFTRTSRSFSSNQFGLPGAWRHSYTWTLTSNQTSSSSEAPSNYSVSFPDGRRQDFYYYNGSMRSAALGVSERFIQLNLSTMLAYVVLPDGGKIEFKATCSWTEECDPEFQPPCTRTYTYVYKAQVIIDPHGLRTSLTYNTDGRLYQIAEPAGRWIRILYGTTTWQNNGVADVIISYIQASDGRRVFYSYGQASFPPGTRTYTFLGNVAYYSDSTISTAAYTYKAPNVPDYQGNFNGFPLLSTAYDPMYPGSMTKIAYDYKPNASGVVAGQILREKHSNGTVVSTVAVPSATTRTETRGDGPSRTFTYSNGRLTSWTDFYGVSASQTYDASGFVASVTDRNIKTTNFTNALTGAVIQTQYPLTPPDSTRATVQRVYTDANYLSSVTNELGRTTTFQRDATTKRITQINYPDGGYETFTYNGFGQVLTHRLTNGGTESFTYDTRGQMTIYRDAVHQTGNPTAWYLYDGLDRVWKVTDARGSSAGDPAHTTVFTYNSRGQITRVTHSDSTYVQYAYDSYGNRISVTDELNHATSSAYDDYRRVTSVTNALNHTSTFNYQGALSSPYLHTTSSVYRTYTHLGKRVDYAYDQNFRRYIMRRAPGTTDDAWTVYGYDPVGNLTSVEDPRENVTTFAYDSRNRRISATAPAPFHNQVTQWAYDKAGNVIKETRPDNKFRTWDTYDAMNRVTHTTGFRTDDTATYVYDLAGNLTQMTDSKGANYDFGYDLLNRKTSATYPLNSQWEGYTYDAAGNLATYRAPVGWTKTFTYDNRNRPISVSWNATYGGTVGSTTTYDAASRVTSIVSGPTTVAFGYDNANNKIWEDQTLSGLPTRRVNTGVDADGNRSALSLAGVYSLTYDYTQRQQLNHIMNSVGVQWFEYSYDANGNLTKRQNKYQGLDSTNFQYDQLNRPTLCQQTGANDVPFATSQMGYDVVGNMLFTWREEQANKGERFGYDFANQLTSVVYNANNVTTPTPSGGDRTVSYTNTPLNRTSMNDNGVVTNYTPNGLNQYTAVTGQAPEYDGNFHLYRYAGWTYFHDADKRLTSASGNGQSAQFVYDGLGRCVKRTINGLVTVFIYDGWKPIAEYDGSGNFVAWNIYGPGADEILVRWSASNGYLHYHSDAMGNVQFLLDANNNGVEKYTYDAFGQPKITDWNGNVRLDANGNPTSAFGNRFMFTGREYLSQLGIYDYRNRAYHPGLGRFLQIDPIGFGGGDANLYRYVGNNPVNRSDPSGLMSPEQKRIFDAIQGAPAEEIIVTATPIDVIGLSNRLGGIGGGGGERGGGGGREGRDGKDDGDRGKSAETKREDDCYTMAQIVQQIANQTSGDTAFMDAIATAFTAANNSSIEEMRRTATFAAPREFGQSGFQPQFREATPGNQVRHFAGGFIAGARLGPLLGLAAMNRREEPNSNGENNADLALNAVSTTLGNLSVGSRASEIYRRYALSARIRELLCD